MDAVEGAVGGLSNPGAGDVRSKANPTTALPTGFQTFTSQSSERDLKNQILIKDNSLPNGKIKLKLDENGLIPHVFEGKHLTKSETCVIEGKCDETSHVLSKNSELLPTQDADQQETPDITEPGDDTVEVSEMLDKLERLTASGFDSSCDIRDGIQYAVYESETQMPDIMRLITKDLSEPYSIYTYRYFIHNWPKLCFLAMTGTKCVGAIVCKLDLHKKMARRGYIAMLAIDSDYRRKRIGSNLVLKAIKAMIADECDEVVLETEITNKPALRLYENLGFVRDKRLFRYYLNGVDALRLKLWLS